MKVLSLFDGMSCGQIALSKLGIKVDKYYASEIDKYAIQITQKNFPDTVQLGDVCDIDPKDFMDVDLLLFGSPCQGFSFAGKQLAFDDPRSALFFEAIRLLKAIKPKYFLAENVRMKKEFLEVFTEQVSSCYTADDVAPEYKDIFGSVKFEPHFINSSLLSAQSRQRYYWTNIPNIKQPKDKGIVLRDILEYEPQDPTLMSDNFVARQIKNEKDGCLITEGKEKASNLSAEEYVKNGRQGDYLACDDDGKPVADLVGQNGKKMLKEDIQKGTALMARDYKGWNTYGMTGVRVDSPKKVGNIYPSGGQNGNVYSEEGKSPTLSSGEGIKGRGVGSNNAPKIETKPKQVGVAVDLKGHDIIKRVYSPEGKSPTINAHSGGNTEPKVVTGGAMRGRAYDEKGKRMDKDGVSVAEKTKQMLELRKDEKSNAITTVGKDSLVVTDKEEMHWRKLTPLECERLQTVPDGYTEGVSNTQRYRMLGNGWTVDVIAHILTNMEK